MHCGMWWCKGFISTSQGRPAYLSHGFASCRVSEQQERAALQGAEGDSRVGRAVPSPAGVQPHRTSARKQSWSSNSNQDWHQSSDCQTSPQRQGRSDVKPWIQVTQSGNRHFCNATQDKGSEFKSGSQTPFQVASGGKPLTRLHTAVTQLVWQQPNPSYRCAHWNWPWALTTKALAGEEGKAAEPGGSLWLWHRGGPRPSSCQWLFCIIPKLSCTYYNLHHILSFPALPNLKRG